MLIVSIFVVLLFVALGIVFANGKGVNLVAGYNTMSAQEKENTDKNILCKIMAVMMFCLAGVWAVLSIGIIFEIPWLKVAGFALFFGVIMFFLIYMNTSNRLKKKNK